MTELDFASGLYRNRQKIEAVLPRLAALYEAVDRPTDLDFGQWIQLYSMAQSFSPGLIIELGRGCGNSTSLFCEAANDMGGTKVVSVDSALARCWERLSVPRLQSVVSPEWFKPLRTLNQDILTTDFSEMIGSTERVLLFWDAHGSHLARYILAEILPLLYQRENLIIVHDVTDTRHSESPSSYAEDGPQYLWTGDVASNFDELNPIFDFLSRNHLSFDTPGESMGRLSRDRRDAYAELESFWRNIPQVVHPIDESYWIYFSLDQSRVPRTSFPSYDARTIAMETLPGYWEARARAKSAALDETNVTADSFSHLRVIYDKSLDELKTSLERNAYGLVKPDDVLNRTAQGLLFSPSTNDDHVCTPFMSLGSRPETSGWVRITLAFAGDERPSTACVIDLQDDAYAVFWSLSFFSEESVPTAGRYVKYARAPTSRNFRMVFGTLDGRPTYLPSSVRVEEAVSS